MDNVAEASMPRDGEVGEVLGLALEAVKHALPHEAGTDNDNLCRGDQKNHTAPQERDRDSRRER